LTRKAVRAFLEQDQINLTIATVRSKIKEEDQRHELRKDPFVGLTAAINNRPFKKMKTNLSQKCKHNRNKQDCWICTPSSHPSNFTCVDCGTKGHKSKQSRFCPIQQSAESGTDSIAGFCNKECTDDALSLPKPIFTKFVGSVKKEADLRLTLQTKKRKLSSGNMNDFIIDSGCSQTILMNKNAIQNYISFSSNMRTANDGTLKCIGKGDLVLNPKLIIKDVLYCPDVTMNLVSAAQICDQGFTLECSKAALFVKKGKDIVLKAKRCQDLYVYHIQPLKGLAVTGKTERTLLFHRRMGHLNLKSLRLLSHLSEGLILDQDSSTLCEVCQQAKVTKNSFSSSKSLASRIGEVTHADICSVGYPTIIEKATMFLVLVDDATRYTTISLLAYKSDAASSIIQYDKVIFNKTGRHLSNFQSDGGGEFFNSILK
jgi:hypothetical protein